MKPNGALLSVAGNDSSVEKIIGGVVSSVWKSFYDEGVACFGEDQKQQVLIADCEVCFVGFFVWKLIFLSKEWEIICDWCWEIFACALFSRSFASDWNVDVNGML
jgi:hypothetical protein